jgi:hypothetical protein
MRGAYLQPREHRDPVTGSGLAQWVGKGHAGVITDAHHRQASAPRELNDLLGRGQAIGIRGVQVEIAKHAARLLGWHLRHGALRDTGMAHGFSGCVNRAGRQPV